MLSPSVPEAGGGSGRWREWRGVGATSVQGHEQDTVDDTRGGVQRTRRFNAAGARGGRAGARGRGMGQETARVMVAEWCGSTDVKQRRGEGRDQGIRKGVEARRRQLHDREAGGALMTDRFHDAVGVVP